jgi:rod shape determining protein RodA
MFDRRLVQYFNWLLLGVVFLIIAIGLLTLKSAVSAGHNPQGMLYTKQLIWYSMGLVVMISCFLFNYKLLDRWAPTIYLVCVLLLIAVFLFGRIGGGSRRWLSFGPFSLQPSEPIKIAVIVMLARYYSRIVNTDGFTLKELITPFLLIVLPFVLIVKQPDLGTALLVGLIAGSITLFVKIERRSLIGLIVSAALCVPAVWVLLKDYQKNRILTFLDPDRDPLGAGYHIIQSKIAIGSGMITGKGYLNGTQNILSFLPEQHTDFIFSVLAEEWGLLGALALFLLFLMLLLLGLNIAYQCRDAFGTILAVGITSLIFWQVIINIGMVMGLMPVVGMPLPLVSYGGSSTLTLMIGIGILLNISMRRFMAE